MRLYEYLYNFGDQYQKPNSLTVGSVVADTHLMLVWVWDADFHINHPLSVNIQQLQPRVGIRRYRRCSSSCQIEGNTVISFSPKINKRGTWTWTLRTNNVVVVRYLTFFQIITWSILSRFQVHAGGFSKNWTEVSMFCKEVSCDSCILFLVTHAAS